mmetsp:Transcript_32929/g.105063  ORF Transcript_32929/g.105063 Transcript_32929/m.105063 type:complete len:277 (-) Transcript_32929:1386-2216(-)
MPGAGVRGVGGGGLFPVVVWTGGGAPSSRSMRGWSMIQRTTELTSGPAPRARARWTSSAVKPMAMAWASTDRASTTGSLALGGGGGGGSSLPPRRWTRTSTQPSARAPRAVTTSTVEVTALWLTLSRASPTRMPAWAADDAGAIDVTTTAPSSFRSSRPMPSSPWSTTHSSSTDVDVLKRSAPRRSPLVVVGELLLSSPTLSLLRGLGLFVVVVRGDDEAVAVEGGRVVVGKSLEERVCRRPGMAMACPPAATAAEEDPFLVVGLARKCWFLRWIS